MITLEHVTKTYDNATAPAVQDLSLNVEAESLLVLLGESGSGKTTTLKMINRLVESSSGTIRVAGQNIRELSPIDLRRRIGYAFQGTGLFPHMNVAANVATVPQLLGWSPRETDSRVDELLDMIGLPPAEFRNRYPHELSGGQRHSNHPRASCSH